jgi:hypothetical protein
MTSLLRHSSLINRVSRDALLLGLCLAVWPVYATSEPQLIYRCGNAYTNLLDPAGNCKPVTGGSVTVIEGTHVQGPQAVSPSVNAGSVTNVGSVKIDNADQLQRDVQAQAVLQAELQRAKQQQAELLREWNNGHPDRRADEYRQPEKYQERVTQLRGSLQRLEADVAGLQRELSRLPVSKSTGAKP